MAPGEPDRAGTFPIDMTGTLLASTALRSVAAEGDADQALTAIYGEHYRTLVRIAALLVRDTVIAEEVVQESFVAMHQGWRRLRDSDKALSYLLRSVVSRSRSVLAHRTAGNPDTDMPAPGMRSAASESALPLERPAVLTALRELPARQREVLVLRYYGDLPEAQIAAAMGIRRAAVQSHTARAIAALRAVLEQHS
jgi:RNA polymerase sigma-70 factor (sigma-E family)